MRNGEWVEELDCKWQRERELKKILAKRT